MSILSYIKKAVGANGSGFDQELLMHINAQAVAFKQFGVDIFTNVVVDEATDWPPNNLDSDIMQTVKSLLAIRVKQQFDPSPNATISGAYLSHENELTFRLMSALGV